MCSDAEKRPMEDLVRLNHRRCDMLLSRVGFAVVAVLFLSFPGTKLTAAPAVEKTPKATAEKGLKELQLLHSGESLQHDVIRAQFGPSPKSDLIVFAKEEGPYFAAIIMGMKRFVLPFPDMDETHFDRGDLLGVICNDIDGDGVIEPMIVHSYMTGGGADVNCVTCVLDWDGSKFVRLKELEKQLYGLESVAAVNEKLEKLRGLIKKTAKAVRGSEEKPGEVGETTSSNPTILLLGKKIVFNSNPQTAMALFAAKTTVCTPGEHDCHCPRCNTQLVLSLKGYRDDYDDDRDNDTVTFLYKSNRLYEIRFDMAYAAIGWGKQISAHLGTLPKLFGKGRHVSKDGERTSTYQANGLKAIDYSYNSPSGDDQAWTRIFPTP